MATVPGRARSAGTRTVPHFQSFFICKCWLSHRLLESNEMLSDVAQLKAPGVARRRGRGVRGLGVDGGHRTLRHSLRTATGRRSFECLDEQPILRRISN
jgi:hypothetical protein